MDPGGFAGIRGNVGVKFGVTAISSKKITPMPKLLATQVTSYKVPPGQTQGKLFDTDGLFLLVKLNQKYPDRPPGKYWMQKYRIHGQEKTISLGTLKKSSLKQAREKRDENLKLIESGIDPATYRRQRRALHDPDNPGSFENLARAWLDTRSHEWAESTTKQATDRL